MISQLAKKLFIAGVGFLYCFILFYAIYKLAGLL